MNAIIKKLFFNRSNKIQTFAIVRLRQEQVEEKVFLKNGKELVDISQHHGMICLDPFCMAIWLPQNLAGTVDTQTADIQFMKGEKLNARIKATSIERIPTGKGELILYKIESVKNYQLSPLHRMAFWGYFLRSKKNTYYSRRVISALYSYPRRIIIVSYKDENYCYVFPMDIQAYIAEDDLYVLGLRTTNLVLDKIIEAGKVVVCDTDSVDIDMVYNLGKQSSKAPVSVAELPFSVTESPLFCFPVPDFTGSYKEIEIIRHRKMGYHMLLVGRIVNQKQIKPNPASLWHIGFLQYQTGNYSKIEGLF